MALFFISSYNISMKKIRKHKILDHSIIGIFLLDLWAFVMLQVLEIVPSVILVKMRISDINVQLIMSIITVIISLLLLWIHKLWFQNQFDGCLSFQNIGKGIMFIAMPAILFCVMNIRTTKEFWNPIYAFIIALSPGVSEEVLFRCLSLSNAMRNVKKESHIILYVCISGLIFGGIHMINFLQGAGFISSLYQVVYATGIGILLASIFLRTGTILPCMILHILIDFTAMLNPEVSNNAGILQEIDLTLYYIFDTLIMFLIPTMVGLYLIRSSKRKEILELWDKKWNRC